jgi:hypothetical protein
MKKAVVNHTKVVTIKTATFIAGEEDLAKGNGFIFLQTNQARLLTLHTCLNVYGANISSIFDISKFLKKNNTATK